MNRRADWRELVELLLVLLAAVAYIFVIGAVITWVRLAAARLPVDASLPYIDNKVLLVAGLRLVVVMAIVFGAMCLIAYAIHAGTWTQRGPEWHSVVKRGRPEAARRHHRGFRPTGDYQASVGDRFVRVIAGFNVGVIAGAFGLGVARILKTFVDQWFAPGPWWDLLAPWVLVSVILAGLFAWIGPLWGNRFLHGVLWVVVVVVALISEAPIGLLVLTWAVIATFGRAYGRIRQNQGVGALAENHPGHLSFVLSPLPWLLLTVYALVGISYYGMPPVSFSQTIVTTPTGTRAGGYLARTGTGLYLVSCTPLADATSINESVSVVPAADITATKTGTTPFVVDTGLRSSLPTLLLHAFGIDATTPAWIRPQVRAIQPTCAGDPLPVPSVGYPAPQLGVGVTAGPAPPGGQAVDGEAPIQVTSPKIAALARRYQPTVLVTTADPFWPVSVGALLADRGANGTPTCLENARQSCPARPARPAPTLSDLTEAGSSANDYLEYPVASNVPDGPGLTSIPGPQIAAFLRGQQTTAGVPSLRQRLANPGLLDPWRTAEIYFYYAKNTDPGSWPAPDKGIKPNNLIALQYWFFYAYNYYPAAYDASIMNDDPIAADDLNTDLHQGDWEHVTVILDDSTGTPKPVWLYTARHSDEGEYYAWNSPLLTFDQGHPIIQAALGGHPSYDAHCRESLRYNKSLGALAGKEADWVVCGSGRFAFRWQTTPLVDLAKVPWACWRGHFGAANHAEISNASKSESSVQRVLNANYTVAGPPSPLWQAENEGVCANGADPAAPEQAAIDRGL